MEKLNSWKDVFLKRTIEVQLYDSFIIVLSWRTIQEPRRKPRHNKRIKYSGTSISYFQILDIGIPKMHCEVCDVMCNVVL